MSLSDKECKGCGDEIINNGKMYKGLCYECSVGEKVWRKIKKEGEGLV